MLLQTIYNRINGAIDSDNIIELESIISELEHNETEASQYAGYSFALGYATYMLPSGHRMRTALETHFIDAIIKQPGHVEAMRYLAYIAIDKENWLHALQLLFAISTESDVGGDDVVDQIVEARVYTLAKLQMWDVALHQLNWFDERMKHSPDCGWTLINFMKLLDDENESNDLSDKVLKKIRYITSI